MVAASLTIVTLTELAEAAGEVAVEAFEPEQALKIPTVRRAAAAAANGRSIASFMQASPLGTWDEGGPGGLAAPRSEAEGDQAVNPPRVKLS
jgi:hypothetical protein